MTTAASDGTNAAAAMKSPLSRMLHATANALIVIAVIAQTVRFVLALNGQTWPAARSPVLDFAISPIVMLPGVCLAFIQFLVNLIRSFRSAPARIKAALFLLVMAWPMLLPLGFRGLSALTSSASTDATRVPSSKPLLRDPHENPAFLQGYDLAKARGLTSLQDCPRAKEAYRGCLVAALQRRAELVKAGSAWAEANRPARASDCQGAPRFALGCRMYYGQHLAKPRPAGQGHFEGMTTAECRSEVDANYELAAALDREEGNEQAIVVTRIRNWEPELAECENYDRHAESEWMPKAYDRLQALIARMKAGGTVTDEEKAGALKDFSAMAKIRDQPYRTAYLKMADEYFARLDGSYQKPLPTYARLPCEAYPAKFQELAAQDAARVAQMRALKRADGVVTDSARYNALNQQRIDMLWTWKYFTDGAKAAGCNVNVKAGSGRM